MVAKLKVTTDFRRKAVKRSVDKANFTSLGRAGAFVRQVMRRSIRRRKEGGKPSAPGQPPKSTGPLREAILWEMSPQRDDVAIGPTFGGFGKLGRLHEEGGIVVGKQFFKTPDGRTKSRRVIRDYPERPFAAPALEKAQPRLPKLWANSVKS